MYHLHYTKNTKKRKATCLIFKTKLQIEGHLLFGVQRKKKVVFLAATEDQIFVSEDIVYVCEFIHRFCSDQNLKHLPHLPLKPYEIFIQEYSSYEAAYKSALEMQEENPLCYN